MKSINVMLPAMNCVKKSKALKAFIFFSSENVSKIL